MKKNLLHSVLPITFASLVFVTSTIGFASSLSKKVTVQNLDQLTTSCKAGIASNGHNFPTYSELSIFNLDLVFPDTNVRRIGGFDPQRRLGHHCAELTAELNSDLPAELVVKQTRTQGFQYVNGVCARIASEELDATLGAMEFVGQEVFVLEPVSDDHCK